MDVIQIKIRILKRNKHYTEEQLQKLKQILFLAFWTVALI